MAKLHGSLFMRHEAHAIGKERVADMTYIWILKSVHLRRVTLKPEPRPEMLGEEFLFL